MKKLTVAFVFLSAALFVSSSVPAWADSAADLNAFKAAIRVKYDLYEKAYNSKDAQTIVEKFFSKDVVSVPPGKALGLGREQVLAGYKAHLDGKTRIVSFKSHLNGNSGADWANGYFTPDDPTEKPMVFKNLFLWEKHEGQWVCIAIMFVPGEFPVTEEATK